MKINLVYLNNSVYIYETTVLMIFIKKENYISRYYY